ncbi:MAG: hypothetical protein WDZ75_00475 [Candidatus Paceibacterota bacterium]
MFSPLETVFTEDTYEGIYGQRLNVMGRGSVTARNNLHKIDRTSGFGGGFFTEMFPFLEFQNGRVVPVMKDQIKLKLKDGAGYRIFFPEALQAIPRGTKKFSKLAEDLKKLEQKDISIFVETKEKLQEVIKLLHSYGVKYKEKKSHYKQFKPGDKILVEENYENKITVDMVRVLAKIAFNYFAYCAIQDEQENVLFFSNFERIRTFIHSGTGATTKDIIPSISEDPILKEEIDEGKRLIAHFINFLPDNGRVVVRMTFYGLPVVYKVDLGDIPDVLNTNNFGCGHAFNPFKGEILNLSQIPVTDPEDDRLRLSFGLFKRI